MNQDQKADIQETTTKIIHAIKKRQSLGDTSKAYRLFNGFYEGYPGLVMDRYGPTLVIFNHNAPGTSQPIINEMAHWVLENLDGLDAVLLKERQHPQEQVRNGLLIAGNSLANSITEFGIHYALNLQMNQDASFYLDTRNLRFWLSKNLSCQRVLNTFAYTGSLGVAAGVGNASLVVQTDINHKFLEVSKRSWVLNGLSSINYTIVPGDFFRVVGRMRQQERLFDCVILDPPYFSETEAGRINLEKETTRLINKVRPLIAHQGWLVIINNAIFLSGAGFINELQALCQSKYLSFEKTILIPPDITGYPETIVTPPPIDPAPFNHPTKIAILRVYRKDGRI